MYPRISVCIPAYGRARYLPPLLDSIVRQSAPPFEVVICEDNSADRPEIARLAKEFEGLLPVRYVENPFTYGYDRNLRTCIETASGDYCLFMGNDDILCQSAIERVLAVVAARRDVGIVTRAYQVFNGEPGNVVQNIRHFDGLRIFRPGPEAVVALYRRTGVLSGLTFRRSAAAELATDRWDGSLYYQLYLTANILLQWSGAYIDTPVALCREGVPPDFGRSAPEARFYTPGRYTTTARLKMFGAMIEIARELEQRAGAGVVGPIIRDLGAYSYYLLSCHPSRPAADFVRYYWQLGRLGVRRHPLYHLYFAALFALGEKGTVRILEVVRRVFGRTPRLSEISQGEVLDIADSGKARPC